MLGSDERGSAAIDVFSDVARRTRVTGRAEALAVVAALAYMAKNGSLAGIVLAATFTDAPTHRLGTLLDTAFRNTFGPAEVTVVLLAGARGAADQLGIGLSE